MRPKLANLLRDVPPPDPMVPLGARGWLSLVGIFLVSAMTLGSIQFSKLDLIGTDSFYHVRVAALVAEHGAMDTFPWAHKSVYRERYVDTEFLFHVLLAPFLGEGLRLGPKLWTVLVASVILGLLAWISLRHGLPWTWLWVFLLLSGGVALAFRLNLTRPHLLSVLLTLAAAHLMLGRKVLGLFVVSVLFPLCYTAAHLFAGLVLLYGIACSICAERFPWKLLIAVALGTGLGIALHPNRDDYFFIWYVVNVGDLSNAFSLDRAVAREFADPTGRAMLWGSGLLLPGVFLTGLAFLRRGVRARLTTVFFFLASCGFLALYLNYQRFIVYWAPFSALFIGSAAKDLLGDFDLTSWLKQHRIAGPLVVAGLLLVLGGQSVHSVVTSQKSIAQEPTPRYKAAATWIAKHVPPEDVVFTCDWDSAPFLLYYAPQAYYLNVLTPNFMLAFDPDLFRLWLALGDGRIENAADRIREAFDARWVLVEKDRVRQGLYAQALACPKLQLRYDDVEAAVFSVEPGQGSETQVPPARSLGGTKTPSPRWDRPSRHRRITSTANSTVNQT